MKNCALVQFPQSLSLDRQWGIHTKALMLGSTQRVSTSWPLTGIANCFQNRLKAEVKGNTLDNLLADLFNYVYLSCLVQWLPTISKESNLSASSPIFISPSVTFYRLHTLVTRGFPQLCYSLFHFVFTEMFRITAAYDRSTLILRGTWAGGGSMSPKAMRPTFVQGLVHICGVRTPSIPRYWMRKFERIHSKHKHECSCTAL